jgi:hypothetical protein
VTAGGTHPAPQPGTLQAILLVATVMLAAAHAAAATRPRSAARADSAGMAATPLALSAGAAAASPASVSPQPDAAAQDATTIPLVAERIDDAGDVVIDGRLDEAAWARVGASDGMRVVEPATLAAPSHATHTRFFHTQAGLFVGVHCVEPAGERVARLSSRDATLNRDGIELTIDTSGRGLYGYYFTVNRGGTLGDGTVRPERSFSSEWDGAWHGASAETEDGWTAELFIPWASISLPPEDGPRRIGFQVARQAAARSERWAWPPLLPTQPLFLSAMQPMQLSEITPSQEYSVYPFVSATADGVADDASPRAGDVTPRAGDVTLKAGADVFWRPSTRFQLSAALNPDFGQVEADDVVVNLSAFETFFPEKRLFFLEGQELFETNTGGGGPGSNRRGSSSGASGSPGLGGQNDSRGNRSVVFTRRAGTSVLGRIGTPDVPAGVSVDARDGARPVDLLGAIKATGQWGPLRYGVLGAFEDDTSFHGTQQGVRRVYEAAGRDFGGLRLLWEDTAGGGRRAYGVLSTLVHHPDRTARVHAVDVVVQSATGRIAVDGQLLASDVGNQDGRATYWNIRYAPRRGLSHRLSLEYSDDRFVLGDFGFLRRNDSIIANYNLTLNESGLEHVRERDTFLFLRYEGNTDGLVTRAALFLRRNWALLDNSRLFGSLDYLPAQWDDRTSRGNGPYRVHSKVNTNWVWSTDSGRPLSLGAGVEMLQEDHGDLTFGASTRVTWRGHDRVTAEASFAMLDRNGWFVHRGGRNIREYDALQVSPQLAVDGFLTARQQLRLQLQWVALRAREQRRFVVPLRRGELERASLPAGAGADDFAVSDLVVQLRYRWNLAPLSDLFVVYNRGGRLQDFALQDFDALLSEAFTDPFGEQLVVKLRYRFGS